MINEQKTDLRSRLAKEVYTYCAFCIALWMLPALAISYVVVRTTKNLWLRLLSSRYPGLEFIRNDTVRSLLDTHRNQGIINVLLSIKGPLDLELIKEQLNHHVIERRDKSGQLMFPRLRHHLVSSWGNYAWDENVPFRPEAHFLVAGSTHRGRPISDSNIQEYVCDTISKYFPSDQSPWQYIIIPCVSTEPKYYILIRVHHLLLTGKNSINIGDLLLLEQITQTDNVAPVEYSKESPLANLFVTPTAIPELRQKLSENMSNAWNEFISEYDPVESPRALKTLPGVFHVAGLMLISGVSALRELNKKNSNDRDLALEAPITATALLSAIQKECKRRNLTVPRVGLINNTLTWKYSGLAQLSVQALKEAVQGLVEMYRAPANLWTHTVGSDDGQKHLLQTVNLCGRKVAAWSRPVSRAGIERAAKALGVSTTDISLFAATEALRNFFEQTQNITPDYILTTARAASEDFLFTFAEGDGKNFKKTHTGGMVCLSLPIGASARRISSIVEDACKQQKALAGAWALQARCGALTRAVPSPLARVTLNLLSRRYAVSYAEINAPANALPRTTLWGQNVDSVIYWRPPQANISMSLTVIQYADTVRLSVMSDSRLFPFHSAPAARWPDAVEQLISVVDQEIARRAAHQQQTTPTQAGAAQSGTTTLRPPATTIVSPPPMRKRIIQH